MRDESKYLQVLNIVVRGGEGGDVSQGVTTDSGVGALTPSHALNMPWSSYLVLELLSSTGTGGMQLFHRRNNYYIS